MCFHPIKIRNPALYINKDIDKPFIEVPCGHCEDCKQKRINDIVVRAYYEWQDTVKYGGFTYFDTLTYNEESVPKLFDTMIFSREHLTKFFKRLRTTIERDGYLVYEPATEKSLLRYLVTTEYGETKSKRPHYHVLFFISIPGMTVQRFYYYVREIWTNKYKFGWNDHITEVLSHVVNRVDGIKYVVKYLTKSSAYTQRLQRLLELHKDCPDDIKLILDNMKNIKPFYRSSLGFGASILKNNYKRLCDFGVPLYCSNGVQFYPMPKYIKYKLHYDKITHPKDNSKTLYKRNKSGVTFMLDNLEKVIDSKTLFYKNLLENDNLLLQENLKDYARTILDGRSLRDFVIYKSIYKGHLFSELSWKDYNEYYRDWLTLPRGNFGRCIEQQYLQDFLKDAENWDCSVLDDRSKPEWHSFDDLDIIFDLLCDSYNKLREEEKIHDAYVKERSEKIYNRFFANH